MFNANWFKTQSEKKNELIQILECYTNIEMGWFTSDNHIVNKYELASTELKIMVGLSIAIAVMLIAYLLLRLFNKYNKRGVQSTVQQEIRLNNIGVQKDQQWEKKRARRTGAYFESARDNL